MNKNELISSVAERADMTKDQASQAIEACLGCIADEMSAGNDVRLLGFGNFQVTHRKATTARNPRTGEAIAVAATNVPKFKPGKALKEAVNK